MSGCNGLGVLYSFGQGVTRDYAQAMSFWQKACAGEMARACENIGQIP